MVGSHREIPQLRLYKVTTKQMSMFTWTLKRSDIKRLNVQQKTFLALLKLNDRVHNEIIRELFEVTIEYVQNERMAKGQKEDMQNKPHE
jgi:predicted ATPase